MFQFSGITKKGVELLAKASAGKTLTFTHMEYGDGILPGLESIVADDETKAKKESGLISSLATNEIKVKVRQLFDSVTELVHTCANVTMYSKRVKNNVAILTGNIDLNSFTEDFRARELGVFARVEDGEEVLFAYFSAVDYLSGSINDVSDYISKEKLMGQEYRIQVEVAAGSSANINIVYGDGDYVLKKDFDAEIESIKNSINELIDFSHIVVFDHVVDSNESLLEWANCNDGSMKSVLIKGGTFTLNDRMINILRTGTKYILGEPGAKLVFNYQKGIGVGEASNETFVIENVDVEVNNDSADYDCYAIYHGAKARNCNFKAVSVESDAYGFVGSSADDCTSIGIAESSNKHGYGFFDCSYCTRCRAGGASTSATWGGTNIKIDSNTCDNA